jgi:hypothetical protein
MLSVIFLVVPSVFGYLLWNSYRTNRARAADGEGYEPAGRKRWTTDEE